MKNIIQKFLKLFPDDKGISGKELEKVEEILQVVLPPDFKEISNYYSGGIIGNVSIFNFKPNLEDEYSLVSKSLIYRAKINLPNKFVVLYDEYGFILLNTEPNKNLEASILDLSSTDIFNLIEGKPLESNTRLYSAFSEYFEYLLDQEEEERKEDEDLIK